MPDHRLHLNVAAVISEAVVEIPDSNLLSPLTREQSESYETALDRLQDYFFHAALLSSRRAASPANIQGWSAPCTTCRRAIRVGRLS
jgi:hypothetical protein